VTVGDWIASRTPQPPPALSREVLDALGAEAHLPAARVSGVCLAAAARSLDSLLVDARFTRDNALELLAIDALTTYAFEHASESAAPGELEALATRGVHVFGQLTAHRV
jgi:hypothetical protein